ncbi:unnamed protein product, partial [marine sediment metagenome]
METKVEITENDTISFQFKSPDGITIKIDDTEDRYNYLDWLNFYSSLLENKDVILCFLSETRSGGIILEDNKLKFSSSNISLDEYNKFSIKLSDSKELALNTIKSVLDNEITKKYYFHDEYLNQLFTLAFDSLIKGEEGCVTDTDDSFDYSLFPKYSNELKEWFLKFVDIRNLKIVSGFYIKKNIRYKNEVIRRFLVTPWL